MTEITKEEYMTLVKDLKPMFSFSDPDGTSPIGNGRPFMEKIWGDGATEIVCCEMSKENRHQNHWDYTYYRIN